MLLYNSVLHKKHINRMYIKSKRKRRRPEQKKIQGKKRSRSVKGMSALKGWSATTA